MLDTTPISLEVYGIRLAKAVAASLLMQMEVEPRLRAAVHGLTHAQLIEVLSGVTAHEARQSYSDYITAWPEERRTWVMASTADRVLGGLVAVYEEAVRRAKEGGTDASDK